MGADRWGPPSIKKKLHFFWVKILIFFGFFFGSNFAECPPFAECPALGKAFAECPTKDTRQRRLCRVIFCRVWFAECYTRRTIRRVFSVFCRVFGTLGKLKESGSVSMLYVRICVRFVINIPNFSEKNTIFSYVRSIGKGICSSLCLLY